MNSFNVGDYIVIKRDAPYGISGYKSTGTILEVNDTEVLVEFDYITGTTYDDNRTFWIFKDYCKPAKQPSQQDKVCTKIRQMEARWLKYQKRKHYAWV